MRVSGSNRTEITSSYGYIELMLTRGYFSRRPNDAFSRQLLRYIPLPDVQLGARLFIQAFLRIRRSLASSWDELHLIQSSGGSSSSSAVFELLVSEVSSSDTDLSRSNESLSFDAPLVFLNGSRTPEQGRKFFYVRRNSIIKHRVRT